MPKNYDFVTYLKNLTANFSISNGNSNLKSIPEYANVLNRMGSLLTMIDDLSNPNRPQGANIQEEQTALLNSYRESMDAMNQFLGVESNSNMSPELRRELQEKKTLVGEMLTTIRSNDIPAISDVNFAITGNLGDIVGGRTMQVDLSHSDLENAVSGQMASRIPTNLIQGNRASRGYVTENQTIDLDTEYKSGLDTFLAQNPLINGDLLREADSAEVLEKIFQYNYQLQNNKKDDGDIEMMQEAEAYLFEKLGYAGASIENPDDNYLDAMTAVTKLCNTLKQAGLNSYTISKLNLDPKKPVNMSLRNCAMSSVANALGISDVIAQSTPVEVVNNEQKTTGIFMEQATGQDLSHILPGDPLTQINPAAPFTGNALHQMVDMQIIDYLCMNVDRHSGNVIFQTREIDGQVVIDGLKGIDNDFSFGNVELGDDEGINHLTDFDHLLVCSESMANRIQNMDVSSLRASLRKYDISEAAIEKFESRLTKMKEALDFAPDIEQGLQSGFPSGKISVIPDATWDRIAAEQTAIMSADDHKPSRFFEILDSRGMRLKAVRTANLNHEALVARGITDDAARANPTQFIDVNANQVEGKGLNFLKEGNVKDQLQNLANSMSERLEGVDKFWIWSSKEFKGAKAKTVEFQNFVAGLQEPLSLEQITQLKNSIKGLETASNAYIAHKTSHTKAHEKARYDAMVNNADTASTILRELDNVKLYETSPVSESTRNLRQDLLDSMNDLDLPHDQNAAKLYDEAWKASNILEDMANGRLEMNSEEATNAIASISVAKLAMRNPMVRNVVVAHGSKGIKENFIEETPSLLTGDLLEADSLKDFLSNEEVGNNLVQDYNHYLKNGFLPKGKQMVNAEECVRTYAEAILNPDGDARKKAKEMAIQLVNPKLMEKTQKGNYFLTHYFDITNEIASKKLLDSNGKEIPSDTVNKAIEEMTKRVDSTVRDTLSAEKYPLYSNVHGKLLDEDQQYKAMNAMSVAIVDVNAHIDKVGVTRAQSINKIYPQSLMNLSLLGEQAATATEDDLNREGWAAESAFYIGQDEKTISDKFDALDKSPMEAEAIHDFAKNMKEMAVMVYQQRDLALADFNSLDEKTQKIAMQSLLISQRFTNALDEMKAYAPNQYNAFRKELMSEINNDVRTKGKADKVMGCINAESLIMNGINSHYTIGVTASATAEGNTVGTAYSQVHPDTVHKILVGQFVRNAAKSNPEGTIKSLAQDSWVQTLKDKVKDTQKFKELSKQTCGDVLLQIPKNEKLFTLTTKDITKEASKAPTRQAVAENQRNRSIQVPTA